MTPNLPDCVGALVRDDRGRVYVHRRSPTRRLLPGIWDIVGGHVEPGETALDALAREVHEETGWRLRHVEAVMADWEWTIDGVTRHEIDYLVDVNGDLDAPVLEAGKHDAGAWVGRNDLELMMEGRSDGDRRLRDIVAKAVRTRLTERLRLEPIGPEHAADLRLVHNDANVATWYGGAWSEDDAQATARAWGEGWERDGVHKWIAYDRATNTLVGRGGCSYVTLEGERRLEMGWALRDEFRGRGYATEIGRAALAYGFDELGEREVVAFTEPHNDASRAVMERLGMRGPRPLLHDGTEFVCYSSVIDGGRFGMGGGAAPPTAPIARK